MKKKIYTAIDASILVYLRKNSNHYYIILSNAVKYMKQYLLDY